LKNRNIHKGVVLDTWMKIYPSTMKFINASACDAVSLSMTQLVTLLVYQCLSLWHCKFINASACDIV